MIALGKTTGGTFFAGYLVSSRSFPDRHAYVKGNTVYVSPRNPEDLKQHPFIHYPCIKITGGYAVVANGDHSEAIAASLKRGEKPISALEKVLSKLGPEDDEYSTPRIAGVLGRQNCSAGIVQKSGLSVKELDLDRSYMVATYQKTSFEEIRVQGKSAPEIAAFLYRLGFELPVCAACAVSKEKAFQLDAYNGRVSGV